MIANSTIARSMHPERVTPQRAALPAPTLEFERIFIDQGITLIAGLDEAGRGALAGPVSAGAVILPLDRPDLERALNGVHDSKLCSPSLRDDLYTRINETALAAGVGLASHQEIDRIGIAAAT